MKHRWMGWLLFCLSGCALHTPRPVCRLDVDLSLWPPWQPTPADFDATVWSALLLRGTNMDCTGRNYVPSDKAATLLQPAQWQLTQHGDEVWLVWLKTHRLADGSVLGPVAQIRAGYEKLHVLAVGVLQTPAQPVRLRLRDQAPMGVLEAEIGECAPDQAGGACLSEVQLLARHEGRFIAAEGGRIALRRREITACGKGCSRVWTLEAEAQPSASEPQTYLLQERAALYDGGAQVTAANGPVLRQSEGTRRLYFADGQWRTSALPMWEKIRGW